MGTMQAYCQGAADKNVQLLAGVVAKADAWAEFSAQWAALLAAQAPKAEVLCVADLLAGTGEFAAERGGTADERQSLLSAAIALVQRLDRERFFTYTAAVDLETYAELEVFSCLLLAPEKLCNHHVPRAILAWQQERLPAGAVEPVEFFFDPGEPYRAAFLSVSERAREAVKSDKRSVWPLVGAIETVELRRSAPAQLAALLAWCALVRHPLAQAPEDGFGALRAAAAAIVPLRETRIDAELLNRMAWARFPTEYLIEGWD